MNNFGDARRLQRQAEDSDPKESVKPPGTVLDNRFSFPGSEPGTYQTNPPAEETTTQGFFFRNTNPSVPVTQASSFFQNTGLLEPVTDAPQSPTTYSPEVESCRINCPFTTISHYSPVCGR